MEKQPARHPAARGTGRRISAIGCVVWGAILIAVPRAMAFDPITFTRADSLLGVNVVIETYGPAWGDHNGDGWDDVFCTNHASMPTLFRNDYGVHFTDVTFNSRIATQDDQHSACWGDYDNDGRRDLYTIVGAPGDEGVAWNQLNHNLDGRHFEDVAREAGVTDSTGRGRYGCFVDVNNDGFLDIYVGNKSTPSKLFINRGDGTFLDRANAGGLNDNYLRIAAFNDYDRDLDQDALLCDPETNRLRLFANNGLGWFTDVTASSGLPSNLNFVWSIAWLDYDNDGDDDVFLSRGYWPSRRDCYALAPGDVKFQTYMSETTAFEDGVDGFDFHANAAGLQFYVRVDEIIGDNAHIFLGQYNSHPTGNHFTMLDGQYLGQPTFTPGASFGCYIWQDAAGGPWHVRTSTEFARFHRFWGQVFPVSGTMTSVDISNLETEFPDHDLSDRLYRNRGNGTFEDVTVSAGLWDTRSGKTCAPADFDNDGWIDLYVVNDRNVSGPTAYNDADFLYMNNGNGTFTEYAAPAGVECMVAGTGAAGASADYDHDGFLDLYVTNGWAHFPFDDGPHVVFHNEGNDNHWIVFRLTGVTSNRDAVGARVRIESGGRAQYRNQSGGVVDMAQSSLDLHFGLGDAVGIDSLTIWWPSGHVTACGYLPGDQIHAISETDFSGAETVGVPPIRWVGASPNPFMSATVLRYRLTSPATVRLALHDAAGRTIRILQTGRRASGLHSVPWDGMTDEGGAAPAGVYFVRLVVGDGVSQQRLIRIR